MTLLAGRDVAIGHERAGTGWLRRRIRVIIQFGADEFGILNDGGRHNLSRAAARSQLVAVQTT